MQAQQILTRNIATSSFDVQETYSLLMYSSEVFIFHVVTIKIDTKE